MSLAELSKYSVHQTPTAVIRHAGEDVLMNCSHSNTDFDMILWYKQSAGKNDMVLVGYVRFSSSVVESPFKDSYNVSGTGGSLSCLHIPKSRSENSAVYFCAASRAQCYTNPPSSTKTSSDADSYTKTQFTTWRQINHIVDDWYQTAGSQILILSVRVQCSFTNLWKCDHFFFLIYIHQNWDVRYVDHLKQSRMPD